jgi:peptidoglycan/LPS O-acetylase OafA/YrhL
MQKKLDYIDALRCFAILMVIMVHTSQYGTTNIPSILNTIVQQGSRGVQLFYIASAFTLFYSFNYRFKQEKKPNRNFFIRRLFRIAPLFYLAVVYYLFQNGLGPRHWLGDGKEITSPNIFSNIFFINGFNPYWINSIVEGSWSIAVEMTFYFCFPFLFNKIKNLNQAFLFLCISLIFSSYLNRYLEAHALISDKQLWQDYLYFYFPSQLPIFALGIILYFVSIKKERTFQIHPAYLILFLIVFVGLIINREITSSSNYFVFGIGFLFVAYLMGNYHSKLLVNPITKYIGKISFGLYLTHFAVLHLLQKFDLVNLIGSGTVNYVLRYFTVLMISVIFASALYIIVEQPMQKLGKKWIQKLES